MTDMETEQTEAVEEPQEELKKLRKASATEVIMHPLVLLNATDHYNRVAKGTRKRVVGALLGKSHRGKVEALNSFAVPFEEDSRNPDVFYLDHNYLENMLHMFRKVNAKENVIGFYSTGPQLRANDLRIHSILQRFVDDPVFCIIDIRPDRQELPVTSYKVLEQVHHLGANVERQFAHVQTTMGAMEAEEIGVEHLLRDINDPTVSTVMSLIEGKLNGLKTLADKLRVARDYLQSCADGGKVNEEILGNLQTIIMLLPNLNMPELVQAITIKTNDMHMAIYLASLIRSVIALHDLVNNKIQYGEDGMDEKAPEEEKKEQKSSEKADEGEAKKKEGSK